MGNTYINFDQNTLNGFTKYKIYLFCVHIVNYDIDLKLTSDGQTL